MITEYSCVGCKVRPTFYKGICPMRPDQCDTDKARITCRCGIKVIYPAGGNVRLCNSCANKEIRKALAKHRTLTEFGV